MGITRSLRRAGTVMALAAALAGCAPAPSSPGIASPRPTTDETITFASVIDGDTIGTSAGTVRLIGIDAPERDECGYDEASTAIGRLLRPGDPLTLELPAGQNDRDAHGRLLRFVATEAGVDLGMLQLEAGNAVARYDSSDGYPAHPREDAYRAAQIAERGADGSVVTTACAAPTAPVGEPKPAPAPAEPPTVAPPAESPWWMAYSSCTRLKKNTAGHPTGPFSRDDPAEADIYDWFAHGTGNRGDGDGDGLACE